MYLLYDLLIAILALLLLPVAFIKGISTDRALKSFAERLTIYSAQDLKKIADRRVVWVHAVSVGEVNAAAPLLSELKLRYPDCFLVLSGITLTGRQIAEKLTEVDWPVFLPIDLPFFTRRAQRLLKPDLIVLIETELWPNFIRTASSEKIPLVLANGRISKRSFSRYRRLTRYITPLLQSFSSICVQDAASSRRIRALGAPEHLVSISGNVKFDVLARAVPDEHKNGLASLLPLNEYIWVAGSTHSGEHEQVLQVHQAMLDKGIPSFLILAPRHAGRFDPVAEMLTKMKVPFVRRSKLDGVPLDPAKVQVLLLDTLGELNRVYRYADVVFVGGSLIPEGGHNLLEAAQLGKPVLFGPHMFDNRETARLMIEGGGGRQVTDAHELGMMLEQLFEDIAFRSEMGEAAQHLVRVNSGATGRTLERIEPFLVCSSKSVRCEL